MSGSDAEFARVLDGQTSHEDTKAFLVRSVELMGDPGSDRGRRTRDAGPMIRSECWKARLMSAARAAMGGTRSISRRPRRSWSRAAACRWPSTATAP